MPVLTKEGSQLRSEARSAAALLAALERVIVQRIGAPRYQLWFAPHTRFALHAEGLIVGVPNLHFQEWLNQTFGDVVAAAAREVLGAAVPVRFAIDAELFRAARAAQKAVPTAEPEPVLPKEPAPQAQSRKAAADAPPDLFAAVPARADAPPPRTEGRRPTRRWHSLAEFVVGASNRVAHAAALSLVEEPGQGVHPLVLHGPVGTGKTHLLEGIYLGLRRGRPDWQVCFATAEDFTNRFVQAMRLGKIGAFRKHFRSCDALLLDDLHFLARKQATQEEFLHTFDALQTDGRPVVLTTDCHPRLSDELMPELTDRLLGGGVWGLLPPDADTRLTILRAKSGSASPTVPDEVLQHLASRLRGNVRELEGALHSVRHFSRVTGRRVDLDLAREALGELLRHALRVVQVADIDRAICEALRLPKGTLQSKQRAWAVSHPRMVAIFLARKHTAAAFSEISRHFGGKSHSTAVAAEKKVRQWLQTDTSLAIGDRPWRVRDLVERVERDLQR